MTDEQIIKAYECCYGSEPCYKTGCPLFRDLNCDETLHKAMVDLINRQKAKIEALQMDNAQLHSDIINANMNLEHMTAEIERLKDVKFRYEILQKNYDEIEQQLHYLNNVEIPYLYSFTEDKDKKLEVIANILLGARTKAIKEFVKTLKEHLCSYDLDDYHSFRAIEEETLDNLVKEMVGDAE